MTYSILRTEQYHKLKNLTFSGTILDLGGSKTSGYHELLQGVEHIITANINPQTGYDLYVDLEQQFPVEDSSVDHVLCLNVLAHLFEYENVFRETSRVIKPGGLFVVTTPFMMHVHGSPDDYHRFTKSWYRDMSHKYDFNLQSADELGFGLFSFVFNTCGGSVPTRLLRYLVRQFCVGIDKLLLHTVAYRRLRDRIPLGYFIVMRKI